MKFLKERGIVPASTTFESHSTAVRFESRVAAVTEMIFEEMLTLLCIAS